MDEASPFGPHTKHCGQVWVGKWLWTWNEKATEEKKNSLKLSLNVDAGINPFQSGGECPQNNKNN
jgi:hypothetical protein